MKNITSNLGLCCLMIGCLGLLSGCGTFDRTYLDQMERDSDGFFMAGRDFPVVGGDSGRAFRSKSEIMKRTPASDRELKRSKESVSLREELDQKEQSMSEAEMAQYAADSKYLPSESDKLYYLSLPSADRASYVQTKNIEYLEDHGHGKDMITKHSIRSSEISLGMSKEEVTKLWGRPSKVQIAGNPKYQNELWMFNEDGSVKQVYFEAGKVSGWALDL